MRYYTFTLKKILKNWLNYIPLLLMIAFIVFIYISFRISAFSAIDNPNYSGVNEIEKLKEDITVFQNEVKNTDESSEEYKFNKVNLTIAENRLKYTQQKIDAANHSNWNEYYKNNLELTNITLDAVLQDRNSYGSELIESLKLDQAYNKYMINNDFSYDDRFKSSQGISYMIKVIDEYLPIMLAIVLIYIISSVYCSTYIENMDVQKLIPASNFKKQEARLLVGTTIGVFVTGFIGSIAILSGSFGNVLGSLNSPVLSYSIKEAVSYIPFSSILPQTLILLLLSILFIVNLVSLISKFTRKNMKCLLISLIIIVGCIFSTLNIVPLRPILHMLPTTYLNVLKVISGELSLITNNFDVNFSYGVIILGLSNVLLFVVYYYMPKLYNRVNIR